MYQIKPIMENMQIDLPTCMYPIKPLNSQLGETAKSTVDMDPISVKITKLLQVP